MIILFKQLLRMGCAMFVCVNSAFAQSAQQQGIASTTQILDTSVLFAIGAREAEQAIRGSFGWPTFQEGFVDRVYFRFDPDGYARFSTSPRLDEDVFEVICAESSTACIAKKSSLEVGLTAEGKIQVKIAGITSQDSFFVSDRKSELPLPPTVLEPLDPRLETLLSTGENLVVKREVETVQEISLSGFSAVATYLRWVAQGQSPRVFPRGWPVPAQVETQRVDRLTQPSLWTAPVIASQQIQSNFQQENLQQVGGQYVLQNPTLGSGQQTFAQQDVTYGLRNTNGQVGYWRARPVGATNQVGQQFNMTQQQTNEQLTIRALQQELDQLRSTKDQSDMQLENDFAKGFAQQAQARNLPMPTGYGVSSNADVAGGEGEYARNSFERQIAPTIRNAGELTRPFESRLQIYEDRIYGLEIAVNEMRNIFLTEMSAFKRSQNQGSLTIVSEIDKDNPIVPDTPSQSMGALEKLLLERLGERDDVVQPIGRVGVMPVESEASDRTFVMNLLKKLEQGQMPSDLTLIEPMPEPTEPLEVQPDGFVTLSDYINNMLKSEDAAGN